MCSTVRLALVSILMTVCAVAHASAGVAPQRWVEVRSTHFIVLTNSGERSGRRVADQFERVHSVFHLLFPSAGDDSDPPITVLAVKDRDAMHALEPQQYLGKGSADLGGLFLHAPDTSYILMRLDTDEDHPYATIYHEYTHYTLRKADAWLPLWLNEGLAQFYENTDIHEKDVALGQPDPAALHFLASNPMLPLDGLFAVDARSPYYHEEQKASIFYAESWALVRYLIVSDRSHGGHRIRDYAQRLAEGQDPVTAARNAFGDLSSLQNELAATIRNPDPTYFSMTAALSPKDAAFSAHPVPQPEVDAVRASILICAGRTQEAQTLLDLALRGEPGNELAHEAMGYLSFKRGDYDAAKRWYGQAVALDSHSFLAHYFYAVITLHGGDAAYDGAVESSLQTSIKLNPQFAPACDALAMFYASRRRSLDQAHMLTQRAVELEPATLTYRIDSAEVLAEQRQFANAVSILKEAQRLATTPGQLDAVQGRIRRFESQQAMLNRSSGIQSPGGAGN